MASLKLKMVRLQNVRDSVDKYDGIMDIDAKGNIFSVTILLKNISEEIGL